MKCEHCKKHISKPIQETKDDYWKCQCGDFHKGYPYKCPRATINRIKQLLDVKVIVETTGKDKNEI